MASLLVRGGRTLSGRVRVEGAKNAVLPILAACLLVDGSSRIREAPPLVDVQTICAVLEALGARVQREADGTLAVSVGRLAAYEAPYELVRRMRASFLVSGPLLGRLGRARIPLPGGCAIGSRPVELHLKGLVAMGAKVEVGAGYVELSAGHLEGSRVYLDYPSVGATENLLMAACLARGTTLIENAAEEPEVVALAEFLNRMGGNVQGAGTRVVTVEGDRDLKGADFTVLPDRIEAGTLLLATAVTGGEVWVENAQGEHLQPLLAKLREAGFCTEEGKGVRIWATGNVPRAVDVTTRPYPGFPTDLQAPMCAFLSLAQGTSLVTETVFENRFLHVDELRRMGAQIRVEGRTAVVRGVSHLSGAPVQATDLRAAAALVIAGLAAEGETMVWDTGHLDRGYWGLDEKLRSLGADLRYTDR